MIADDFGTTFIGKNWLNLVNLIKPDEESLEKGKNIAEREAIRDMNFEKSRIIADIEDSGELFHTAIIFLPFSPKTKTKLVDFLRTHRNILPDTYFSVLSEELFNSMRKLKIFLIPEQSAKITTDCSCGRTKTCEHEVALIFSSANEIEKNPSILFRLRGFDLKSVFKDDAYSNITRYVNLNSSFSSFNNLKITSPVVQGIPQFHIDAVNILSIFKLLPEKPLFYSREDFRTLLLEKYKSYAGYAADYPVLENLHYNMNNNDIFLVYYPEEEVSGNSLYSSSGLVPEFMMTRNISNIKIHLEEELNIPVLNGNEVKLTPMKLRKAGYSEILTYFLSTPLDLSFKNNSASSRFLNAASSIALMLIKNYAYVPEVRFINDEEFIVSYCPLVANKSIEQALKSLKDITPANFVFRKKDSALLSDDVHIHVLQLFINCIITSYETKFGRKHYFSDQKMYNTFFRGEVFRPEKYDEYQNGLQAALWLEKLSYINMNPKPLLVFRDLSEDEYEFIINLKFADTGKLMELSDLLSNSENTIDTETLRSRIVRQLNFASEYFPELAEVTNTRGVVPGKLNAKQMYDFLKKTEPVLSLLGIKSDIPSEMKMKNVPRAVLTARLKNFMGLNASIDIKNMVAFEWKISVGDNLIPVDEYFRLAAQEEGLINIDGTYFINDSTNNENLLSEVNKKVPEQNSHALLKILLSGEFNGTRILPEAQMDEFLDSLFSIEETEIPEELNAELRDYQVRGFAWLYSKLKKGFGLCLADDMGLGKTVQVIAVLLKFKSEQLTRVPVLVICPTSLVANWYKELEKFAPSLRVFIYHGSRRRFELNKHDVLLTTYGIIRNETEKFKKYNWNLVIIDEAQNIKNWESEQAKSIKMLDSQLHLAMSGTPVENRLTELWSIFDFINKDYLGTYHHFRSNYAIPIEKYGDSDKLSRLRQITSPFILRRMKSDPDIINDLPDKIELDEFCYLTKEQTELYKKTVSEVFNKITHSTRNQRSGYILNLITYLKQICNHPSQFTKEKNIDYRLSGKTEKLVDLVSGFLDRDEKALIFTQYKEMGQILCMMLKYEFNIRPLFFHGSLSVRKRDEMVEQFQNKDEAKIMIISIKAGGTGLNLTAAERVVHFDLWWNPAVETQATDRTYRIGQDKNVTVHRLISVDTFEEKIDRMLRQKRELADLAIVSGEPSLYELSNKELKQLFKLGT